jgi:hypothetical protein
MRDRVQVIARATFLEAVRDRVLFVVLLFAVGVVLFSRVLGWLSIDDELKMVETPPLRAVDPRPPARDAGRRVRAGGRSSGGPLIRCSAT